jgi:hypothetical protein
VRNTIGNLLICMTNFVKGLRGAHPSWRVEVALKVDEPELDLNRSARRVSAFSQVLSRLVGFGGVVFGPLPMCRPQRTVDCEVQRLCPPLD